jgi:hypothetical protein
MNSAMSIGGQEVGIRPVVGGDISKIHRMETAGVHLFQLWHEGTTPSPVAFQSWLWRNTLSRCMVVRVGEPEPLAAAFSYNPDFRNGCAHVGIVASDTDHRELAPLVGFGLFVSYLFRNWPLRRLYAVCREYAYVNFASGINKVFTVVGRLEEDGYANGQYWDTLILQITRDTWEDGMGRYVAQRARLVQDSNWPFLR